MRQCTGCVVGGEPLCGVKDVRGVATRYRKLPLPYGGMLNPVSALVTVREATTGRRAGARQSIGNCPGNTLELSVKKP